MGWENKAGLTPAQAKAWVEGTLTRFDLRFGQTSWSPGEEAKARNVLSLLGTLRDRAESTTDPEESRRIFSLRQAGWAELAKLNAK